MGAVLPDGHLSVPAWKDVYSAVDSTSLGAEFRSAIAGHHAFVIQREDWLLQQ
jgi:hypothetical protein